jgi:hypothetical protein
MDIIIMISVVHESGVLLHHGFIPGSIISTIPKVIHSDPTVYTHMPTK